MSSAFHFNRENFRKIIDYFGKSSRGDGGGSNGHLSRVACAIS